MTLRLDDRLAKKLDQVCKARGYKKNGLLKTLISDFLTREEKKKAAGRLSFKGLRAEDLEPLIGIMSIGGDAVEDAERYYE
ncbi:MAG: hypothetical protein Q7T11_01695 [Deltaproteobacteria bacterium]|nr:hypothetical protein [Deltaproteobacteria bacterium]